MCRQEMALPLENHREVVHQGYIAMVEGIEGCCIRPPSGKDEGGTTPGKMLVYTPMPGKYNLNTLSPKV